MLRVQKTAKHILKALKKIVNTLELYIKFICILYRHIETILLFWTSLEILTYFILLTLQYKLGKYCIYCNSCWNQYKVPWNTSK